MVVQVRKIGEGLGVQMGGPRRVLACRWGPGTVLACRWGGPGGSWGADGAPGGSWGADGGPGREGAPAPVHSSCRGNKLLC